MISTSTVVARFYPEGTIISSGLSKWAGAGGWRLGTFLFPPELRWLLDGMAVVASETFTATSAPIQYAAVPGQDPSRVLHAGLRLEDGLGVLEVFAEVGLTQSRGEARRMLQQGGIYVNDQRVDQVDAVLTSDDVTVDGILLRAGKKKYHRLAIEE